MKTMKICSASILSGLVLFGIILFGARAGVPPPVDPRLAAISQATLEKAINQTALDSPNHLLLIARAHSSHLDDFAYAQYKKMRDAHPSSSEANLLAGIAAQNAWWYHTAPFTSTGPPTREDRTLLVAAQSLLSQAVQLDPSSAKANLEYGYFVWQNSDDVPHAVNQGYALVERAVLLSPDDPSGHALLGDICSCPFGSSKAHYDPKRAAAEYTKSITLDPRYAYPHLQMVYLNLLLKQYPEAQTQMTQFLSLCPPEEANNKGIKILQTAIQKQRGGY